MERRAAGPAAAHTDGQWARDALWVNVTAESHSAGTEGASHPRGKISRFRSIAISLPPEGFEKPGDEKLRDLVAFLCYGERDPTRTGWRSFPYQRQDHPGGTQCPCHFPSDP
jgi:hypothetical protein